MKHTKVIFAASILLPQLCSSLTARPQIQAITEAAEQLDLLISGEVEAPDNPEFTDWRNKHSNFRAAGYQQMDDVSGYLPSPFDMSYLKGQKVSSIGLFSELPEIYDLRDYGFVSSVQDQGKCGSCWTFGTFGSLEGWLLKYEGQEWNFSENHLKNYHGFDYSPCNGGNHYMSLAYLARWSGPVNESDNSYNAWDDRPSNGGQYQKVVKTVMEFTTPDEIKNALMTYGALHSTMYMDQYLVNPVDSMYYYEGDQIQNHGITLVGWDDNIIVPGAPGPGAWIVKNSWGRSFGEEGFFYISYFDSKAVDFAVTFCDAVPTTTYMTNYQYDPLGKVSASGYSGPVAWGANVFIADSNEPLGAVGFYMLSKNSSYEIYIYDSYDITDIDYNGQILHLVNFTGLLGSVAGSVTYSGYYTIDLPVPVALEEGDDFAVVIKFTTSGYNYPVAVEFAREDYSSAATANPGESYISPDGILFVDTTVSNPSRNVCIKALTIPTDGFRTISSQVSAGVDDGYFYQDNSQTDDLSYSCVQQSDCLKAGVLSGFSYSSYMVFRDLDIPENAEIVSAHLKIQSYNENLTSRINGYITGRDMDNNEMFPTEPNESPFLLMNVTSASIDWNWDSDQQWFADAWYISPDISGIISEIVIGEQWSAGKALVLFYIGNRTETGIRFLSSFERDRDNSPMLEITYRYPGL
jgi:C1A family cysteine protease